MADLGTLGGTISVRQRHQRRRASRRLCPTRPATTTDHAFRYTGTPGSGGAMVDLGTLGGANSKGFDINDAGFVVGEADRAAGAGRVGHALAERRRQHRRRSRCLARCHQPNAGRLLDASRLPSGINNNGLITGIGFTTTAPAG